MKAQTDRRGDLVGKRNRHAGCDGPRKRDPEGEEDMTGARLIGKRENVIHRCAETHVHTQLTSPKYRKNYKTLLFGNTIADLISDININIYLEINYGVTHKFNSKTTTQIITNSSLK